MVSKNRFVANIDDKTFLDSADTISLIDSAYVLARSPAGLDSAGITNLIDSAYVSSRSSGAGGGGASVVSSDTAPSNPSSGDLWYDTTELALYTYYTDDSDVSYWVSTQPSGTIGGSGGSGVTTYADLTARDAASPDEGALAYITSTDDLYIYNGSSWDRAYAGADDGPQWDSAGSTPPDTLTLIAGDSASVVSISATDPEGFNITYDVDVAPANQTRFTITNNNDGTFSFLPDSAGSSNSGDIIARFRASDGLNYISKSSTITLSTFPQRSNLIAYYDFRKTSSWDGSSSTVYDLSENGLNVGLTIGSGSYLNGTGIGGATALNVATDTTMSWTTTQVQNVSSIMVIFSRPTDVDTVLFNNGTNAYLGTYGQNSSNTHALYGITGIEKTNGVTISDNRTVSYNALSSSLYNSWAATGITGTSTYGLAFNSYQTPFNSAYELQAIMFWSVDLTAAEIESVHNIFSSMATFST